MATDEVEVEVGNRSVRSSIHGTPGGPTPNGPEFGDLHEGIDDSAYRLDTLLEWAERDRLD